MGKARKTRMENKLPKGQPSQQILRLFPCVRPLLVLFSLGSNRELGEMVKFLKVWQQMAARSLALGLHGLLRAL